MHSNKPFLARRINESIGGQVIVKLVNPPERMDRGTITIDCALEAMATTSKKKPMK